MGLTLGFQHRTFFVKGRCRFGSFGAGKTTECSELNGLFGGSLKDKNAKDMQKTRGLTYKVSKVRKLARTTHVMHSN